MSENGNKPEFIVMRPDGRLCIHESSEKITFDVHNMNDDEAGFVFRYIASFIISGTGDLVDDYREMKDEPTDDPRICIVYNPNTREIRFATIGIDVWTAERLCVEASAYLLSLKIGPVEVIDGGTDNG